MKIEQPALPLKVQPLTELEEIVLRESFTHELFLEQLRETLILAASERRAAVRASRPRTRRSGSRGSGSNSRRASR